MAQAPDQQVYTTIQYVNQRNGNRPPSIKDSNGTYFTISDAAVSMAQNFQGQQVNLSFYVNQRGYHVATGINGQQLPRDNTRGGGGNQGGGYQQQSQPQGGQQGQPHGQQRGGGGSGVQRKDLLITYSGIAKSCIESGSTIEQFYDWCAALNNAVSNPPRAGHHGQQDNGGQQQNQQQQNAGNQQGENPFDGAGQGYPPADPDLDDAIPF